MGMDENCIPPFIEGLVSNSNNIPLACSNWAEGGCDFAASFCKSNQPDALFVIVRGNEYELASTLDQVKVQYESLISLIKLAGELVESVSLIAQIHVINIPNIERAIPESQPSSNGDSSDRRVDESSKGSQKDAYGQIMSLVSLAIAPYFDYVSQKEESKLSYASVSATKKSFSELALSLRHLQHRIQSPELLAAIPSELRHLLSNPDSSQDPEIVSDSGTLNSLTKIVNLWIQQIQSITTMTNTVHEGSTLQDEVQFWAILEVTLTSLREQTRLPEVRCAIEILNAAKRFQVTLAFQNNLGIAESLEEVRSYNELLKDLPLSELAVTKENINGGSSSIEHLDSVVKMLFGNLKRWKGSSSVSLTRMVALIELLLEAIAQKLANLLMSIDLVSIIHSEFVTITSESLPRIFSTIDDNIKFMVNLIRELMRKRQEKFMPVKIESPLLTLIKERLEHVQSLRHRHEELSRALTCLEGSEPHKQQLALAYTKEIVTSNPFDFSRQGLSVWSVNQQLYSQAFTKVSQNLSAMMNRKFDQCHVFAEYVCLLENLQGNSNSDTSTLFLSFIDDRHKLDILEKASTDIENVIALSYSMAEDANNEPAFSFHSNFEWELSAKARLSFYTDGLMKLLGESWRNYSVGSKIDSKITSFLQKMSSLDSSTKWINHALSVTERMNTMGSVLRVIRLSQSDRFQLEMNWDTNLNDLLHQGENLLSIGVEIPSALRMRFDRCKALKPIVYSIKEHLSLLEEMAESSDDRECVAKFGFLVENVEAQVFQNLEEVSKLTWSMIVLEMSLHQSEDPLANAFQVENSSLTQISMFQESVHQLHHLRNAFHNVYDVLYNRRIPALLSCEFSQEEISAGISEIQSDVNTILRADFWNLDMLVETVNRDISAVIAEKCKRELESMSSLLSGVSDRHLDRHMNIRSHVVSFEDGLLSVTPPLESSKSAWIELVSAIVMLTEKVCLVSKSGTASRKAFSRAEVQQDAILKVMSTIENAYVRSCDYISQWKSIESLFSLENDIEEAFFPPDMPSEKCLGEVDKILKMSKIFDDKSGVFRVNDAMHISFSKIAKHVSIRFDAIQEKVLQILIQRSQLESRKCAENLSAAQASLLKIHSFTGPNQSVLASVGRIYAIQASLSDWNELIQSLTRCQSYLYRRNVSAAAGCIYVEQLEGQLSTVKDLHSKKLEMVNSNFDSLTLKLRSSWSDVLGQARELSEAWSENKPISAALDPSAALAVIARYRSNIIDLIAQRDGLLEIAVFMTIQVEKEECLAILEEDIEELKFVWTTIQSLWERLEIAKNQNWGEIHVREFKHQMEGILNDCNDCHVAVRQYSAFNTLQSTIREILKNIPMLLELKSSALEDRHWEQIFALAGLEKRKSARLSVRDVLEINHQMHEGIIRDVLEKANGEQQVQESLSGIRDDWSTISFETFNHGGKCRLIKNWSSLFDQCAANLGTLANIKHSVFHAQFERERDELESKLNILMNLLNTWVKVQEQWVYLDGVFGDNSEIKTSLPLESSRFNNISFEFLTLLKRVSTFDLVIDVITIKDLPKTMNRLSVSLMKTVKGLTDFLDQQRDRFPRLFFLGNEDLLELLGSGNHTQRINKHMRKMFPGVASISIDQETSLIRAVSSPQGEVVELIGPVSLIKNHALTQWLTALEMEIKFTMSAMACQAVKEVDEVCSTKHQIEGANLKGILDRLSHQILIVAFQVRFTKSIDKAIASDGLETELEFYNTLIGILSDLVAKSEDSIFQSKMRCLLIESLHHRDIVEALIGANTAQKISIWNSQQLFYCNPEDQDPFKRVFVKQGRFEFAYGFEYLGVVDRLANTPLVSKCFLAMSQALAQKLGGSPFGPAGTGKTECVKALGQNLGRMVLVFCCDESFDYQSMGRLLLGICKVGCWGCFDEFNRLEETILSSLSTQIELIETSLQLSETVELSNKELIVNPHTGIFVTMNPEYSGRNELPENLKKLFRGFAMNKPDKEKIAGIILTSQGFSCSRELSEILIPFFSKLQGSVSHQRHYDFGLRAIKSILNKAGSIRKGSSSLQHSADLRSTEISIIVQSLIESVAPKLVKADEMIFENLLSEFQLSDSAISASDTSFTVQISKQLELEGLTPTTEILRKCTQLLQIQQSHHGFMLVGHSGSGKTTVMDSVLKALREAEDVSFQKYTIDSKVLTKEKLYGSLDPITREWTDGLLTKIIREIAANVKGELERRTWVVFDGDIDPEWAENLNSLLDDNKLLTLPNGERLELPPMMRIVFEVSSLDYATPATVSRCAMVWFDKSLVAMGLIWNHHLHLLRSSSEEIAESASWKQSTRVQYLLSEVVEFISSLCLEPFIEKTYEFASSLSHIMDLSAHRVINGLFVYLKTHISDLYTHVSSDTAVENLDMFVCKALALSFMWAFGGDCRLEDKEKLREFLSTSEVFCKLDLPSNVFHCKIAYPSFEWDSWAASVEHVDLEPNQVLDPGVIVPTVDTVMHETLIHGVINKHSPLILCGPPGSGKTMTFLKALRSSSNLELISLNFSKDTTPEALLSTLEQHCEYKVTNTGVELSPKVEGKWAVVFCDEINLPSVDKFGSQRTISFMRQLVERSGFWRPSDLTWVDLHHIQFVGACNDPNDPGRNKLEHRFMRHVTLVMVDYPGQESLSQIYTTFNRASLKCAPSVRHFSDALTNSMIGVYDATRLFLTTEKQSHYIYSPRELTRWCRGILDALMNLSNLNLRDLIRLWYHEGLRLFYDRIVEEEHRLWCQELFWSIAARHFPNSDLESALKSPVLYSMWLTGQYEPVSETALSTFMKERLRVFSEEEMEVDLILFEDMLDHALRIDRVLRQHQGHMILVGPSTSGKTCLTKFVTWMNGMRLVQLKVHSDYTVEEFESALRDVLISCAKGDQICFLIDESSILEASFIERMNSLLANSEIPGLFEGEEFDSLVKLCATEASMQGLILDTTDEIYKWFTSQITKNLHVVFTMSELQSENRPQINSSPALFNRCVMSWMGDWSDASLGTVAEKMIGEIPLDQSNFTVPSQFVSYTKRRAASFRDIVVDTLVWIHREVSFTEVAVPKQFLDFLSLFKDLFTQTERELEQTQRQTNIGLDKLRETVLEVGEMKKVLSEKKTDLQAKDQSARKMLNKMISDQNESERKREFSVATKAELEKQEAEISTRRAAVMRDLELAEPAVIEAQRGVQDIKKQHLTELRSMSNPPASIKLAMESVCVLLGYQVSSWRDVQSVVRQDDFIAKIVTFDNESQLSPELRNYMEEVYLSRSDYNFETIHRASKACGPLLQWVIAQIRYSEILIRVGPLREEVAALEAYALKCKAKLMAIAEMIQELEQSIETYKNEYSEVIREAEKIKSEMSNIEEKVSRSLKLIENLTKERQRWQESTKDFQKKREQVVGNSILGAAFSTYCGDFGQKERKELVDKWKQRLKLAEIQFESSVNLTSMLTSSAEKACWSKSGLPDDELFVENFAIQTRSDFPLIIDPTGEIQPVLEISLGRKYIATSFLSDSFIKTVEDALKFGGIVLVQNAELYNPVLDSVLRNDISHRGGRRMIQIGSRSVVLSEQFGLILYTRDSRASISAFVKSRTTPLNFTITQSNLESRVLNASLEHFDPDLEKKRVELGVLHSDYNNRLLSLREQFLSTLNNIKGTILDNDDVIDSLEKMEVESKSIDEKMAQSEKTMMSVVDTRSHFGKLASHSKNIFAITMSFAKMNRLYNFSFRRFIELFKKVLDTFSEATEIEAVVKKLYDMVYRMIFPTLRNSDKASFYVCLAVSYHTAEADGRVRDSIIKLLEWSATEHNIPEIFSTLNSHLTGKMSPEITDHWDESLEKLKGDRQLEPIRHLLDWYVDKSLKKSRRLAIEQYCSAVFGGNLANEPSLTEWVRQSQGPYMFPTSESYDITFQIKSLARSVSKSLVQVSMGAKEGVKAATGALESAMRKGTWVLVQNIQMSPLWLTHLSGILQSREAKEGFQLFMTCSLDAADIPNELIGMCSVFTTEVRPQWKTMLSETFESLIDSKKSSPELHVCFLLSWYHTTIQERLKYAPLSFEKNYDINESDVIAAGFTIGKIFEKITSKSELWNEISWTEIAFRVGQIIYGGKISSSADSSYCIELANSLFCDESQKSGFNLVKNDIAAKSNIELIIPDATSAGEYQQWIAELPATIPLEWIGLESEVSDEAREREAESASTRASKLLQDELLNWQ